MSEPLPLSGSNQIETIRVCAACSMVALNADGLYTVFTGFHLEKSPVSHRRRMKSNRNVIGESLLQLGGLIVWFSHLHSLFLLFAAAFKTRILALEGLID